MRKPLFLGLFFFGVLIAIAGEKVQPLNIKTGLWEMTMTTTVTGRVPIPPEALAQMTPEQRAKFEAAMAKRASEVPKTRIYKNCITREQLNKDPFGDEKNCTKTVLKSTGSKMDIREVCVNQGVKSDMTTQIEVIDSERVKGVSHVTATGSDKSMNVSGNFTGKWLGAACPHKK